MLGSLILNLSLANDRPRAGSAWNRRASLVADHRQDPSIKMMMLASSWVRGECVSWLVISGSIWRARILNDAPHIGNGRFFASQRCGIMMVSKLLTGLAG
ncbi:MAG: hypothetical protein ACU84Q_05185 [Gammaproteobacteria bacterium]